MIVVDTNVISELMKVSPSPEVLAWERDHREYELYTTSVSLAEIGHGIERLPEGRRKELLSSTADDLFASFEGRVLPFDTRSARRFPKIVADRERIGLPIDAMDAQIAAICHVHQATLVTRNLKDFQGTGIALIDPWQ